MRGKDAFNMRSRFAIKGKRNYTFFAMLTTTLFLILILRITQQTCLVSKRCFCSLGITLVSYQNKNKIGDFNLGHS